MIDQCKVNEWPFVSPIYALDTSERLSFHSDQSFLSVFAFCIFELIKTFLKIIFELTELLWIVGYLSIQS